MTGNLISFLLALVEAGETTTALRDDIDDWLLEHGHRAERLMPGTPDWLGSIDAQAVLPGRIVRAEQVDICPDRWVARVHDGELGAGPTEAAARLAAKLRGMQG